jgi:uncharacterized protein (TIGR03435 family)
MGCCFASPPARGLRILNRALAEGIGPTGESVFRVLEQFRAARCLIDRSFMLFSLQCRQGRCLSTDMIRQNCGSTFARTCRALCVLTFGLAAARHLGAQSVPAASNTNQPSFDVISIHEHAPGYWPKFERMQFTQDGLIWQNALPQSIIIYAYNLRDPKLMRTLIPGAPKWIRTDWCDIRARFSEADIERLKAMDVAHRESFQRQLLQSLLVDRFKLKAHLVPTDSKYFELTVASNGPKNIKLSKPGEKQNMIWINRGYAQFSAFSLAPLILFSQEEEDDVLVMDKTGLTGNYDYEIKWARSPLPGPQQGAEGVPQPPPEEDSPQFPRALEEQLGLKLVPVHGQLDRIVIDSINKPSPN